MGDDGQVPAVQLVAETAKPQVTVREAVKVAAVHVLPIVAAWVMFAAIVTTYSEDLSKATNGVYGLIALFEKLWFLGPLPIAMIATVDAATYYQIANRLGRVWARVWDFVFVMIAFGIASAIFCMPFLPMVGGVMIQR
jgi:hypothetical protein